jgi:chemotaxis protein methyltransferase CheR
MPLTPAPGEIERFRTLVSRRLGLNFENGKLDYLADIMGGRLEDSGCRDVRTYLARFERPEGWREEWRTLAEKLTVAETYFFRNPDHFRAFAEGVLPEHAHSRRGSGEIRILSAGCASGEEAYSLAILARERLGGPAAVPKIRIVGIDVNPAMIQKAVRARYSPWSLRETPANVRDENFRTEGRDFVLHDAVRAMVTFEEKNLVDPDPRFWKSDAFDIVFCRNVTMYFSPDVTRAVIAQIAQSLTLDGHLFLGHAETLRGISEEFHLRHTHGTFYYQRRRESGTQSITAPAAQALLAETSSLAAVHLLDSGNSWMDVIRRASDRIASLAGASEATPPMAPAAQEAGDNAGLGPRRTWDLSDIVELLRKERFEDAMKLLKALPRESTLDPDTHLLRAVILTNGGDLAGARETCRQILGSDELNAGAHYLLALCLEHEGDRRGAQEHDQTASYLDPNFAMPRFHLGILAKREGNLGTAREELRRALGLLTREDSSRILLFAGGFSRDALVELCRSELQACEGGA